MSFTDLPTGPIKPGESHYVRIGSTVAIIRRIQGGHFFIVFIAATAVCFLWWLFSEPGGELTAATEMDWSTCESPELQDGIYYMDCGVAVIGWEREVLGRNRVGRDFLTQRRQAHIVRTEFEDFFGEWSGTRTQRKNAGLKQVNGHHANYIIATSLFGHTEAFNHGVFVAAKQDNEYTYYDCVSRATSFAMCESALGELTEVGIDAKLAELGL